MSMVRARYPLPSAESFGQFCSDAWDIGVFVLPDKNNNASVEVVYPQEDQLTIQPKLAALVNSTKPQTQAPTPNTGGVLPNPPPQ